MKPNGKPKGSKEKTRDNRAKYIKQHPVDNPPAEAFCDGKEAYILFALLQRVKIKCPIYVPYPDLEIREFAVYNIKSNWDKIERFKEMIRLVKKGKERKVVYIDDLRVPDEPDDILVENGKLKLPKEQLSTVSSPDLQFEEFNSFSF